MAKLINRYALFDAIRNITYNSKDADAFFEEVLEVITEQPTTTEAEIRAKAINEFFDELQKYEEDDWLKLKMLSIYHIAEQLKERE